MWVPAGGAGGAGVAARAAASASAPGARRMVGMSAPFGVFLRPDPAASGYVQDTGNGGDGTQWLSLVPAGGALDPHPPFTHFRAAVLGTKLSQYRREEIRGSPAAP